MDVPEGSNIAGVQSLTGDMVVYAKSSRGDWGWAIGCVPDVSQDGHSSGAGAGIP